MRAAVARRRHAVEQVDARGDRVEEVPRRPDPHEVTGAIRRERGRRSLDGDPHGLAVLADAHAADGVPHEAVGRDGVDGGAPQVLEGAALDDAEEGLVRALDSAVRGEARGAPVEPAVRPIGRLWTWPRSLGSAGQWSKAMNTSGPSARWISIARSGVMRIRSPSMIDLNVTPSSSSVLMSAMLKTW